MTRQQVRERAVTAFMAGLDEMIPEDPAKPLRGGRFADWEDQLEAVIERISPVVLEGRTALEQNAEVTEAGRCPHCQSANSYLEKQVTKQKRHGPHGQSKLQIQNARCRDCGGSFSPSGS